MNRLRKEENNPGQGAPTFFIHTFGCQMNESDSEHIAGLLTAYGWQKVDLPEESRLVIVNTCAVRAKSVEKFSSLLGRLKELKRKYGTKIAVVGCVAQLEGEDLLKLHPEIDFILGPDNYADLPKMIERQERQAATAWSVHWREHPPSLILRESQVSAYMYRLWKAATISAPIALFPSFAVGKNIDRLALFSRKYKNWPDPVS